MGAFLVTIAYKAYATLSQEKIYFYRLSKMFKGKFVAIKDLDFHKKSGA